MVLIFSTTEIKHAEAFKDIHLLNLMHGKGHVAHSAHGKPFRQLKQERRKTGPGSRHIFRQLRKHRRFKVYRNQGVERISLNALLEIWGSQIASTLNIRRYCSHQRSIEQIHSIGRKLHFSGSTVPNLQSQTSSARLPAR
jgi:hypothetical protein